jgi:hypothetical protein
MKRKLRILWAHVRCESYLLWSGLWKGQIKLVGYDNKDCTVYIGAVTVSRFVGDRVEQHTFYTEE